MRFDISFTDCNVEGLGFFSGEGGGGMSQAREKKKPLALISYPYE